MFAVDTGHGVPGAFMSLVEANGLNSAVNEHKPTDPGQILDDLNKYASISLSKAMMKMLSGMEWILHYVV